MKRRGLIMLVALALLLCLFPVSAFALTPGDMAQIAALPPFGGSGHDPDQLDF